MQPNVRLLCFDPDQRSCVAALVCCCVYSLSAGINLTYMLSHVLSLCQDDESPAGTDDSSKQSPGQQSEAPPGYGSFLDAHVRT